MKPDGLPEELIPSGTHTITEGEAAELGDHEEVTVSIRFLGAEKEHEFTTSLDVTRPHIADVVEAAAVPEQVPVEKLGRTVRVDAEPVDPGVYIYDYETCYTGHTRRVTFHQVVPCSLCGSRVDDEGSETAIGPICESCEDDIAGGLDQ